MKQGIIVLALLLVISLTGCVATGNKPVIENESTIRGIPPLYWFRAGEDGYVIVPPLLSFLSHNKERTLTLGMLGLVHFGMENRKFDENDLLSEKFAVDVNFLGIWTTYGSEKANGAKINKVHEGLFLGGLFGIGSYNDKTFFRIFGFKVGGGEAEPIDRTVDCPICGDPVKFRHLECESCGQLFNK
ncbi:MAG: hypothetical protein ACYS8W_07310 [Planctomycetota bacterium]|jgi:hypothetical protein